MSTFEVILEPVNDAPSFVAGQTVTVLENAGPQAIGWATAINAGPANEAAQAVTFATFTSNSSLFSAGGQPLMALDGTLSFTPAFAQSGTASVTVTATDDGGTANGGINTATATFTINVVSINQPPAFTGGGDVTSDEDVGPQSLLWATGVSAGANEAAQTVSFSTLTTDPGLFISGPSVSPTGVLTYTSAPNANGTATVTVTAQDDGGTANGGVDTTSDTFTLTVAAVNDSPTFAGAGNQTLLEDAGPQALQWATAISPGPSDESTQIVSLSLATTNTALFDVQPLISAAGVLTYTPAANASGVADVTLTVQDDGGIARGGTDTSAVTFTINVTAVNDAPLFTGGGNQSVLEDAGPQAVPWASAIASGPGNEASQHVAFAVLNDDNALFAVQPGLDGSGTLRYTPSPDANGIATITVTAQDDGGTANGGTDSTAAVFTITIDAINDAPSIAATGPQSAKEDDGPQAAALTSFTAGPANESGQTFTVDTTVDHPEFFEAAGQPAVDTAGTLTYIPASGAYGTATVTLTVSDDGGTINGGIDSTAAAFTITLVPLPPTAGNDAYTTTVTNLLTVNASNGVLANDADVNSSSLTVTPQTTTAGLLGGTLTLAADGSFSYQAPLIPGQDQFSYTITNGNGDPATGTITIDVSLAPPPAGTFYLQTGGLSPEVWALGATPPPVAPIADLDADGHPGLTIAGSDGKQGISEAKKQHAWTYETGGSTFSLHGPLTLNLTAASHNFDVGKAETIWLYVYNCPGGSSSVSIAGCTLLAQNKVLIAKWNTTASYATHPVTVSVDADLAPARQLRVRLLVGGADLWIPLAGPYNSSVDYTG